MTPLGSSGEDQRKMADMLVTSVTVRSRGAVDSGIEEEGVNTLREEETENVCSGTLHGEEICVLTSNFL